MSINYLIRLFTYKTYKLNILSHSDLRKMRYGMSVVSNELIKLILLLVIFIFLDRLNLFLFSAVVLFSIRIFSGGVHFNSNIKCFIFSLIFFMFSVSVLPSIHINMIFPVILSVVIIFIFSPAPSFLRPIKSIKRKRGFKYLSLFFVLFWLFILYKFVHNPIYLNCGLWTIVLQSIQLLLKGVIKHEI